MPPTDSPNTGSLANQNTGPGSSGRDNPQVTSPGIDRGAAGIGKASGQPSQDPQRIGQQRPGQQGFGEERHDQERSLGDEARHRARQSYEQVRHFTGEAMQKAREQLHEGTDRISERARGLVDERKSRICRSIEDAAQAAHAAGQTLEERDEQPIARWAHMAGDNLDRLSHYLQRLDVQEMTDNVRDFARRHPEIVLGGMFVAGLVVARFLKADQRFEPRRRPPHGADEQVWRDVYESQFEGEHDWDDEGSWGEGDYRFGQPAHRSGVAGYNPSGGFASQRREAGAGYGRSFETDESRRDGGSASFGAGSGTTAGMSAGGTSVGQSANPGAAQPRRQDTEHENDAGDFCPPGTEPRGQGESQQRGDWQ